MQWLRYPHAASFEHLTPAQGLSQNTPYCAIQDRQGFLWFGTGDGLNRYDGNRFVIFRHDPNDPHSLAGNWVTCLLETQDGRIWIGTRDGGLSCMDPLTQRIRPISDQPVPRGLGSHLVISLAQDAEGNLWIGTQDNGLILLPKSEQSKPDPIFQRGPSGMPGRNVTALLLDTAQTLWVGLDDGGLCRLVKGKNVVERYQPDPAHPEASPPTNVLVMSEDSHGVLWFGGRNGLYSLLPDRKTFKKRTLKNGNPDSLRNQIITSLYRDRVGDLWIGTDGAGLTHIPSISGPNSSLRSESFTHRAGSMGSLADDAIEFTFEDRSGVLWVGTDATGLNKLVLDRSLYRDMPAPNITQYRTEATDPLSLSGDRVNAILEDHLGHLWVGTDGYGLNRVIPPANPEAPLRFQRINAQPSKRGALQDDVITCMLEDSRHRLWLGCYVGGLARVEHPEAIHPTFTHFKGASDQPGSLDSRFITSLCEDPRHRIWVGTNEGSIFRLDPDSMTFHRVQAPGALDTRLLGSIYVMTGDAYGTLWIGTLNGLLRYSPEAHAFKWYQAASTPGSLSHPVISSLHIDQSGVLWVGTRSGGLNRASIPPWEGPELQFERFGPETGLPNESIQGILEVPGKELWLSTRVGLCKFNPRARQGTPLPWHQELRGIEFKGGAAFQSPSGELFFGGDHGFTILQPAEVTPRRDIPPIVLTDFRLYSQSVPVGSPVQNKVLLRQTIGHTREIVLSHRDHMISFEFTALHFVAPDRNQYAFMLEGLDNTWTSLGSAHSVNFNGLPPGDYVLRIKGSNCDGIWNDGGCSLRIRIQPPWWRTWWAYGGYLALAAGALILILQTRTRILRQRNRDLQNRVAEATQELHERGLRIEEANRKLIELNEQKNHFMSIAVHDLRNPLAGIVLSAQQLQDTLDPERIRSISQRISRVGMDMNHIVGRFLDISAIESGAIKARNESFPLSGLLKIAGDMHQAMAAEKGIRLKLVLPEGPGLAYGDPTFMQEVLNNLISNALKFSPHGTTVTMRLEMLPERVIASIEDEGPGITEEDRQNLFRRFARLSARPTGGEPSMGLGLSIVKHMVDDMGGRIWVENLPGKGAAFRVELPVGSHLI